jgi:RNA polymerase sigma-70 factor (ECF subfamily)
MLRVSWFPPAKLAPLALAPSCPFFPCKAGQEGSQSPQSPFQGVATHTTPASLLERLRLTRQDRDWNRFVALYTPLLMAWAWRFRLTQEDAENVVQDVFLVLFRELPQFSYDPGKRFRGFLWQVLKRKCLDVKRQRVPVSANEAEMDGLADLDGLQAVWDAEHNQWLAHRALAFIRENFGESTWRAFWGFVVEDRPAAEVASALGLTENAVYIAKWKVVKELRRELKGLVD